MTRRSRKAALQHLLCTQRTLKGRRHSLARAIQLGSHASDNAKGESQAASQRVADIGQPLYQS